MEPIIVLVERNESGELFATSQNIPRVVTASGNSLKELEKEFKEAFEFHLEGLEEDNDPTYQETKQFKAVNFKLKLSDFLKLFPEIKMSALAKRIGMDDSLLRQYKNPKTYISIDKALEIQKKVHELGKELLSVSFV